MQAAASTVGDVSGCAGAAAVTAMLKAVNEWSGAERSEAFTVLAQLVRCLGPRIQPWQKQCLATAREAIRKKKKREVSTPVQPTHSIVHAVSALHCACYERTASCML